MESDGVPFKNKEEGSMGGPVEGISSDSSGGEGEGSLESDCVGMRPSHRRARLPVQTEFPRLTDEQADEQRAQVVSDGTFR